MKDNPLLNNYVRRVVEHIEPDDIVETKDNTVFNDGGSNIWAPDTPRWIDSYSLKNLYFTEDWVYIVVHNASSKISDLHLSVVEIEMVNGQVVKRPALDHPLQERLDNPNSLQGQQTWLYNKVADLLIMGNNVDWLDPESGELWQVPAERVTLNFGDCGELDSYTVSGQREDDTICVTQLNPDDVIHTRRPNPSNAFWGLSPFIPGGKSILFNRYSSEYLNNFYLKGATPTMALEMGSDSNTKSALRMLRSFELAYTGRRNQRRTMLAPAGVSIKTITPTLADQQLKEYVDQNRETIINLLAVPKSELSLQDSGSLGSQETRLQLKNYWESTLLPTGGLIVEQLNKFFADELGENFRIEFDLSPVDALRDDKLKTSELADRLIRSGVMTINEVRKDLYNKEGIDGGDVSVLVAGRGPQEIPPNVEPEGERPRNDEPTRSLSQGEKFLAEHKDYWMNYLEKKFQMEQITERDNKILAMNLLGAFIKEAEPVLNDFLERNTKQTGRGLLRKLLKGIFDDFEEEYADQYVQNNEALTRFGYEQSLTTPAFNNRDAQAIAVLQETDKGRDLLAARGIKSFESIKQTEVGGILGLITRALDLGKTQEQISEEIAERYTDPVKVNARTDKIARTETGIATMVGKEAAGRDMSKVLGKDFKVTKTWLTILDGRERFSHRRSHLETVDKNEKFSNGMRFPLDPNGDADERINCRCDMIFNIEEKE